MVRLRDAERLSSQFPGWRIMTRSLSVAVFILTGCAGMEVTSRMLRDVVDVKAGERHTCVLTSAGAVKCWGLNHDGQLGDGKGEDRSAPVDVVGLTSGVKAITSGWRHTCAIRSEGGVQCWGNNNDGQVGDGTKIDRQTPQDVEGLMTRVTAISAGERHTCALTTSGGVKCWGQNHDGQLGDGTRKDKVTPVDVTGLTSGVTSITTGWRHTCALTKPGGVKCWGNNHDGQVGDGTRTGRHAPIDVAGLTSGVRAIASGWRHVCVLTSDGGAKCWGSNHEGQLGDGTGIDRKSPVDVVVIPGGIVAIAAGGEHTCALSQGTVTCWGENEDGQLGDGTFKSTLAAKAESGG